jgi:hypothetical protein
MMSCTTGPGPQNGMPMPIGGGSGGMPTLTLPPNLPPSPRTCIRTDTHACTHQHTHPRMHAHACARRHAPSHTPSHTYTHHHTHHPSALCALDERCCALRARPKPALLRLVQLLANAQRTRQLWRCHCCSRMWVVFRASMAAQQSQ